LNYYLGETNDWREATLKEDACECTDIWVGTHRVSVRTRTMDFWKYRGEFTLRKHELPKIQAGLSDYFVYMFITRDGVRDVSVIDLRKLGDWLKGKNLTWLRNGEGDDNLFTPIRLSDVNDCVVGSTILGKGGK
jgi:hypothetical protein